MFRRRFFKLMTLATAGALAPLEAAANGPTKTAVFQVTGFSCVTCATGLDTMLLEQEGIVSSKSTYPQGVVTVNFDPRHTTEQAIAAFIATLGFTAKPARITVHH